MLKYFMNSFSRDEGGGEYVKGVCVCAECVWSVCACAVSVNRIANLAFETIE